MTVGFQRTVVSEMFDPYLLASVADTGAVERRTSLRYDRTLQYVATVAFADSQTVVHASNVLMRIHRNIRGTEPLSGGQYDANDPDAQLWIHLTQWHSVLRCYEQFGPGLLSEAEDLQYWAECRRAAAFQTIDPETVPASRDEMRAYYEQVRPRLAVTETTRRIVRHLLAPAHGPLDEIPALGRLVGVIGQPLFRQATIATLPRWLRELAGIQQSVAEDAAITAAMKPIFAALAGDTRILRLLDATSPATRRVIEPAVRGIEPLVPVVVSPNEAWQRAGLSTPREQHLEDLATRSSSPIDRAPADDADNLPPLLAR